jgi:hypothetical protein
MEVSPVGTKPEVRGGIMLKRETIIKYRTPSVTRALWFLWSPWKLAFPFAEPPLRNPVLLPVPIAGADAFPRDYDITRLDHG